ncbi:MAG: hypothetical protein F4087_15645 [Gemmatimonadetes bacterium]|nr:hypothetical protein [Gemmatimonadota bacterium]MYE69326.1 hypothetical protein [Gemmatimonadota bacterium]MYJ69923.1 hypothetical protein [Gemmatimonadota bacterium]
MRARISHRPTLAVATPRGGRSVGRLRGWLLLLLIGTAACERDLDMLDPAPFPPEAAVFIDGFGPGVQFSAFGGSKVDALDIEQDLVYEGTAALKFTIPAPSDPSGSYAGGVFYSTGPRDLSQFDALTFWARASTAATLNTVGIGNDNAGNLLYAATMDNLPLSTRWTKFALPLPLPAKLTEERGLFLMAEGSEFPIGYDIWFDNVQFERLGTIVNPRPEIATQSVSGEVGGTLSVGGTRVTFDVNGTDRTVTAAPAYFTFSSSNSGVATVAPDGSVQLVGRGTATITASLGSTPASGEVTVNVSVPPNAPPPTPEVPAEDVISLFSDAYADVHVDTWSAVWDQADVEDVQIGGNAAKKYTNLNYAGIEFTSQPVDASAMTELHVDLWTNDASAFRIKLVDFGANGVFGGGDDTEHEITLNEGSMPPIKTGEWNVLDIPLSAFAGLASRGNLAQMIISGSSPTVYLDNVFFYKTVAPEPAEPAPTPTHSADKVVSLFSDAYDDATVDTWSASWDQADVEDVEIAGDATKKYSNLVFAGIEFTSATVDATAATHFHFDLWTPDATSSPAAFRVKLVDFGADGGFGGGDDTEHEIALTDASDPPLASGEWVSYDIPFEVLEGLTARGHLAQMIISGDPNTVFLDNIYFYSAVPSEPPSPAPTPSHAADSVISLFSDTYTDATVDTWSASWDQADVEDVQIGGNTTKKYTNLVFAGIEFTSSTIDASEMTHFRMDFWTPDATGDPAAFRIKLVDFGAGGVFGGGDDTEHELTLTAATDPALATGQWVSFDIPLSAFTGLTNRGHLAQLIISGDPNTVFIDNVYLRR